ncbi:Satratoxin biosynthesis SC1 cluster protein 4 [Colletotrichum fructicola]|uniref:Integral membrane protein n=1 Tax=Colletotrichum fructicola (strain Nara gc5) TaxID=1213859 RepID=L2FP34_COLFN|nr:uncharacterized protein CGMCC3_g2547 [Colletotrichum fructicola]KAF4476148.1 Satratoxin biosynthesis SC1 cluster protein 4 [Colletotrichum fructicola Nara gc5]KAE9581254.1 hypothetical protein CGMCC3_g2547 [Colletotrichum fructicola]KAF4427816.1 Satratoxin biosynthesis SC1 cluster protein 4 [Colletotrichum fructicola]KAF4882343.1 Satratoxin biosynthesis SC1 cluster protein 4 [Colletotrichum fructicola]KAF4885920.1 Satratoxin biosynthesis SC1 cluster protein 4 [Colletotrichum fructicola]
MEAITSLLFDVRQESSTTITDKYPHMTQDGASLVVTAGIMMVLTTLWTIMRLIARQITGNSFQLEDYLYFAGQVLYYGVATSFILGVVLGGAGHDVEVLDPDLHISHFVKIFLAAQVMYASELLAIKLSIIVLMQRIFSRSSTWFRYTSWVAIFLSSVWALYTALLGFVICQPIQSAWDIYITKTGCGNYTVAFSAVAIFDIITDVVIVVLPIKVVSGLQMARAHKVATCVVFGAGFITIIFSGVRLYNTLTADFVNITKGFASASVSGVLQSGIAVMVASSPMLRPVFDRTVVRWFSLSIGSGSRTTGTAPSKSQGPATIGSRPGQHASHVRSDGFKQMSDSDENLSWEMQGLGDLKRKKGTPQNRAFVEVETFRNSSRGSQNDVGIEVTRTVAIER